MRAKGVSLLEVLVVIGIFSVALMMTFPYSLKLINQNRADSAAKQVAYELFHQQQDAYSGSGGKDYGVAFYSDHIVSFVGASVASAESTFSIPIESPVLINESNFAGTNEVLFHTGSFRPVKPGYLTLTDSTKVFRITINNEGLISYSAE